MVLSPGAGMYRFITTILSELESGKHSVHVVALYFFDENSLILKPDHPYYMRLLKMAEERNIKLFAAYDL
jgi:hypothetical protein